MILFEKIRALLTPAERRAAVFMLLMMIVGMLLETLGIGLVIPAVSLMIQGDGLMKSRFIAPLLGPLHGLPQASLIIFSMIGLVVVYLVKNVYLAFLVWKQTSFALDVQASLSKRLFTIYLRQPYTFHLQRNSAQLVRNITSEVASFSEVITSLLLLLTESFVLVGITLLLMMIEPVGVITMVVVLGGAAWIFHRSTRVRISRWGGERQHHEGLRIQHLQQGLGGAKDVKLLGREKDFLARFDFHNRKSTRVWKLQTTLQGIPRLMFELLAVMGLAVLVITMLSQGREMSRLVPVLGLFAAAAFRLMPSANRILGAIQNVRYNLPVINHLYDENLLQAPPSARTQAKEHCSFQHEIKLNDVRYTYPAATKLALDGISIAIKKGELVGFVGTSGSGKSTLVDIILGLLPPSGGGIEIDGRDIQAHLREWQDQIGYVPQSIYLTDDSLRRNVAFGLADGEIDEVSVQRAINAAQLKEFVDALPDGLDTEVGERGVRLSGGQRQRIGIARALYHDPSVMVFDEATSALDIATETDVMEVITALKGTKTMILVAHRLSTIERCDRLYRLEKGRVVSSGSPDEVLIDSAPVEDLANSTRGK